MARGMKKFGFSGTIIIIVVLYFENSHANFNKSDSVLNFPVYTSTSSSAEGRQLGGSKTFSGFKPFFSSGMSSRSLKSDKLKTRIIERGSSSNVDFEDHPYTDGFDHSITYKPTYSSVYGYNSHGTPYYEHHPQVIYGGYNGYMHNNDIDAKEAALKSFGVGLSIGLGALGLLTSLLKLLLLPLLALGALLLLLTAPVPVITTGKMLLAALPTDPQHRLKKTIEEVIRKLPSDVINNISKAKKV